MRKFLVILLFGFTIHSCGTNNSIFPSEIDDEVKFRMSLQDFKNLKGNKVKIVEDGMDFRIVYLEEINGNKVSALGYYFDADGDQPLYEIIVIYKSEELRKGAQEEYLGEPNYKDKEWKIEGKDKLPIHVWSHKAKIVYALPLPGTEWETGL